MSNIPYPSEKGKDFETFERERREWYLRVSLEERIPERIRELSYHIGYIMSDIEPLQERVNKFSNEIKHWEKAISYIKKHNFSHTKYFEFMDKFEKGVSVKNKNSFKMTNEIVIAYLFERLPLLMANEVAKKLRETK